jgi:hypothetical protein
VRRTGISRQAKERPLPATLPAGWPVQFIPEKEFQTNIEQLAHSLGWLTSHSHLPFFDTAGWPDLAMVHEGKQRFMVRELKVTSAKGRIGSPTPTQWRWLVALKNAGIDADVWTWPFDWDKAVTELSR